MTKNVEKRIIRIAAVWLFANLLVLLFASLSNSDNMYLSKLESAKINYENEIKRGNPMWNCSVTYLRQTEDILLELVADKMQDCNNTEKINFLNNHKSWKKSIEDHYHSIDSLYMSDESLYVAGYEQLAYANEVKTELINERIIELINNK